ncbi:MAG: hypothetical protein U0R49_00795 [Fimbriimonadales bacterium]
MTRIKICGVTRLEDALAAADAGAHAVGFVFDANSPRYVGNNHALLEQATRIPYLSKVAVFGALPATLPAIAELCDSVQWVQGERPHKFQTEIRAVRIHAAPVPDFNSDADAILFDAFSASAMGGTGTELDLAAVSGVISQISVPVILAGGLRAESVGAYITEIRPYGVDVSSGVESSPGVKDAALICAFCDGVRAADRIE